MHDKNLCLDFFTCFSRIYYTAHRTNHKISDQKFYQDENNTCRVHQLATSPWQRKSVVDWLMSAACRCRRPLYHAHAKALCTSAIICRIWMLIHAVTPDTTKLSSRVLFGGRLKCFQFTRQHSRQLKTVADRKFEVWTRWEQSSNPHRHTRHDTDMTVLLCLVWRCELCQPDHPISAFGVGVCRAAQALPVRPPDALRRRTHLSGSRTDSIHTATPDRTRSTTSKFDVTRL